MNSKVSVICCYNDKEVLTNMLEHSLNNQNVDVEQIFINNTDNKYSSAAAALNHGASISNGDILCFVHQDIELIDNETIMKIIYYIEHNDDCILGLAGKAEDNYLYTNMKQGRDHQYAGEKQIDSLKQGQILDESFVALKKDLFMEYQFDEQTCSNWHLYTVDLCLTLGSNNVYSYVIPCDAYHFSLGNTGIEFYISLLLVARKHHADYPVIYATCATISTSFFNRLSYVLFHIAKVFVKTHLFN